MAKPAFDPNQPFKSDESLNAKPAFDANKPFQSSDSQEPQTLAEKGVSWFLKPAAGFVGSVGQAVDPYVMAPFRAAVSKAQNADVYEATHQPGLMNKARGLMTELVENPIKAGISQFGNQGGPTSKDIAAKAGVPTNDIPLSGLLPKMYSESPNEFQMHKGSEYDPSVTPAGLVGAGVEMALPSSVTVPHLIGKGLEAVSGVAKEIPINAAKDVSKAAELPGQLGTKLESVLAHVPEKNIEVFKERYPVIRDMADKYHNNPLAASESLRSQVMQDLKYYKDLQNAHIDNFLRGTDQTKLPSVEIGPMLKNVDEVRGELTERLDKNTRKALKDFSKDIQNFDKDGDGRITARNAWDLYKKFKQRAQSSYMEQGEIYSNPASPELSSTSRSITAYLRSQLGKISPELDSGLKGHAQLHDIEEMLAPSVLTPNASPQSIYRAGSYVDEPARAALENLGKLTGKTYVESAENIAAMRAMYDPRLESVHGLGGLIRTVGRPMVKTYERATQPGFLGSRGYGYTTRGLMRGARISQEPSGDQNQ